MIIDFLGFFSLEVLYIQFLGVLVLQGILVVQAVTGLRQEPIVLIHLDPIKSKNIYN